MRVNYVIIFVSDMDRSVSFYRDVLGLPLKFQTPEWTEFATKGSTIALHVSERRIENAENDQREHAAGRCRSGFCVPKLDDYHQRLIDQKVECVQEPKDVFGARIAQYVDPDGLVFSVSEETIDV